MEWIRVFFIGDEQPLDLHIDEWDGLIASIEANQRGYVSRTPSGGDVLVILATVSTAVRFGVGDRQRAAEYSQKQGIYEKEFFAYLEKEPWE